MRCHATVVTTLKEERHLWLWKRQKVAWEGACCITCHRVKEECGKVDGERCIEPGSVRTPMYDNIGGGGGTEVIAKKEQWKVKPSPEYPGPNGTTACRFGSYASAGIGEAFGAGAFFSET